VGGYLGGYLAGYIASMPSHVLAFALLSFILIVIPGPNLLFVVSRSLTLGRAAGVGTAVGGQLGVYAQVGCSWRSPC
jgi:threonine/homoserine/homoserine lactone efflux protein